ncbi:MAG: type IV pilus biogenesis/stability protein PilW [Pseudomonadota bacterium]
MMKRGLLYPLLLLSLTACGGASEVDERANKSAKIHTELAASYFERGQYAIALQEIGAALQSDDSYAQAYNVRALVHMTLKEDEEADRDFRRSLKLDPGNAGTHNNYGWFLCQRGRAKESIPQFLEALKDPLYATPDLAYSNAGVCAIKAGDLAVANSYLERALILHPEMPEALVGMAELNYTRGDYVMARMHWQRFLQTDPQLDAAQLWLAVRIARKMNDRNAEASYAMQLRNRFPDSTEAQRLQARE